ncbi:PQQ-binding-like beta-propeller repeat protein [Candidatus Binatus sp.]|uniref:outer membrane protein assembly factor BamB family protein n=1 Tax=Candidatus Binatus sp. TaxID=2811406 RepID=UPI003C6AEE94
MFSRWLRWLVVAPVVLFVLGAILLSCGGGSSNNGYGSSYSGGGGGGGGRPPGFSLISIVIADGAPPSPTFTPTSTASDAPTPTKTPKAPTPTLTARPTALPTTILSIGPDAVPTGGTVAFNAIGTFVKPKQNKTKLIDITAGSFTLWTSSDNSVFQAPLSGPNGGIYTTGFAGCACILASSGGVSSQFVPIGVYTPVDICPACGPTPTASATPTATASPPGAVPASLSTPAASGRSTGVLMWAFDAGSELRGRIAAGIDGSIFFITRDGMLHGLNSKGKEILRRNADGSSPAVMPDGTVIAMTSGTTMAAIGADGGARWSLEIGDSAGPVAVTDSAIYASAGDDLVSVSSGGSLNWRVSVGRVKSAAVTPDGVVVGTSRGAVTAIASDGGVLWTLQPEGGFSGSVAYADDVVYAGSAGGGVYAIDQRTGSPIWHVNSAHAVSAGPVVAASGAIFAGSDAVYRVTTAGQIQWQNLSLKPGDAGVTALGYDGVFDAAKGDVGAVLTGDGRSVWTARGFGRITTAASSPSGMLYIATSTGRIFAVR